jgi:hypothetical protein
MKRISKTVGEDFDGRLIKDFLRLDLSLSQTLIKKVKFGGVSVNGEVVTMRKTLHTGDAVEVSLPSEDSEHVEPVNMPLSVLYEDEHILAVDKPVNMPTHPSRYNSLITLANSSKERIGLAAHPQQPAIETHPLGTTQWRRLHIIGTFNKRQAHPFELAVTTILERNHPRCIWRELHHPFEVYIYRRTAIDNPSILNTLCNLFHRHIAGIAHTADSIHATQHHKKLGMERGKQQLIFHRSTQKRYTCRRGDIRTILMPEHIPM